MDVKSSMRGGNLLPQVGSHALRYRLESFEVLPDPTAADF